MCNKRIQKLARISVRGVVQGVGFRPAVFHLASKHGLKGGVCNTSEDVKIEVEGEGESIDRFLQELEKQVLPLAHIESITHQISRPKGYRRFQITKSRSGVGGFQLISQDIATCPPCREELFDPKDRRYRYPFTNCTHCGPRFTIIEDMPYDRPMTTMRHFKVCQQCQSEYEDPMDRRFHAQPIACPKCGPRVKLVDRNGLPVPSTDPIVHAGVLLDRGKILALKGLGGFLLVCDATNPEAVRRLRQRKKRAFKPLAVMMTSLGEVKRHCHVSPEEESLLISWISPIVLLRRKGGDFICEEVAPNLKYLGVMLPYTPLHHLLMREVNLPLVMTSGNPGEEPIINDNEEALRKLARIADFLLHHDREIFAPCDDSVTMTVDGKPLVLRRARGYAPSPIRLWFKTREILACGAELKNTFCIAKDEYAFLSPHIGDMENLETLGRLENMIDLYRKLFRVEPKIVAHDAHPDYLSTHYAQNLKALCHGLKLIKIQHHHAHIVSCMTENQLKSPVLGVAFDGTGYGSDGHIWGGEFLLVDYGQFRRMGHIQYVSMPGGTAAILRPYRMALSYLYTLLGETALGGDWPCLERAAGVEIDLIKKQIEMGINAPITSSVGRLFDGVSALIGVRERVEYEAQAAIELEMVACDEIDPDEAYPFEITDENGLKIICLSGVFRGILGDLSHGITQAEISARFHNTVARMITEMCEVLAESTGIRTVALSGGVFQNRLLLRLAKVYLERSGLDVYTHGEVPCNDGGVSLGQAVVANFICQKE